MWSKLNPKTSPALYLKRRSWLGHVVDLTDDTYTYGQLRRKWFSHRCATMETAEGVFSIKFESLFSRSIIVSDSNGQQIAKATRGIFSRETLLTMGDGFQASFFRESIWSRRYIWESPLYGPILSIKSRLFSFTTDVEIAQSTVAPQILPLLILLGEYFIILRRQRKAAAAH